MSVPLLAAVLIVVVVTLAIASLRTESAERAYNSFETARKVGGAVILVLLAVTFLQSGRWYLILAGLLAVALGTLYIAVEQPHKEVTA